MINNINVIGLIPAHLDSVRLKEKVLIDILGIPMIEHVRRRAINSGVLDKVIVVSGDNKILNAISGYGGEVIKTNQIHLNGTSRAAEASKGLDCSHVIVIQGDEPLVQNKHIENIVQAIKKNPLNDSWNSTCDLKSTDELMNRNIVKASINEQERILYCFRKSPSISDLSGQLSYIKKIQGLIAYKKDVLIKLSSSPASICEQKESIEQLRIISNGYNLLSVKQKSQVPSINIKEDLEELFKYLKVNKTEYELTRRLINN